MDPASWVVIGATAVGALVQWYNAEKARGATMAELSKIRKIFVDVVPPYLDINIDQPPDFIMSRLESPDWADPVNAPQFNFNALTPEAIKVIGNLNPVVAQKIVEIAPTTIQNTGDMQTGRAAQMNALRRYQDVANNQFDPQYQQAVDDASRRAQGDAQSRQASIMQDFARRGIGGSTMNLAAQIGSASMGGETQALANQRAATDAYRNRLDALSQSANLGRQISQDDVNLQAQNANIINSFNQRVAKSNQDFANQTAGTMNEFNKANFANRQRIEEMNANARNSARESDRERLDNLTKYGAEFAQSERDRLDRLAQQTYANDDSDRRYMNTMIGTKAAWQESEKDEWNRILQQRFENEMEVARAKSGLSALNRQAISSAAQDRNAAIQGLSNAAMAGATNYMQNTNNSNNYFQQANMEYYKKNGKFMSPEERDGFYESMGG